MTVEVDSSVIEGVRSGKVKGIAVSVGKKIKICFLKTLMEKMHFFLNFSPLFSFFGGTKLAFLSRKNNDRQSEAAEKSFSFLVLALEINGTISELIVPMKN